MTKCLIKKCKNESKTRELCNPCYIVARKYVMRGVVDWAELEKRGMSGKVKHRGRTSLFEEQLNQK